MGTKMAPIKMGREIRSIRSLILGTWLLIVGLAFLVAGQPNANADQSHSKKSVAAKKQALSAPVRRAPAQVAASKVTAMSSPSSLGRSLASAHSAGNDPNRAVEVRGQSRTLSMMLVLKNGKENINFIKVRKDYNPEILATPY